MITDTLLSHPPSYDIKAGSHAAKVYYLFLLYCLGAFFVNANLRLLETETSRTIDEQTAKRLKERAGEGSIRTGHAERNGNTVKKEDIHVLKKEKKHGKRSSSEGYAMTNNPQDHDDEQSEIITKRPPTAHLARAMSVPRRPNPFHLLFGYPSSSRTFNWLSFAINLILICFCLDFQFTPLLGLKVANTTFVRVGAVSDTSVKLIARLPPGLHAYRHDHPPSPANFTSPDVTIVFRPTRPTGPWQYGGLLAPEQDTDFVGVIKLESLLPSTEYEYAIVVPDHLDDKLVQPSIHHPQYFKTAPDPKLALHQTHFTFAASSCIKPNWPYVPLQDHLSVRGAVDLADRIALDKIEFLVGGIIQITYNYTLIHEST